MPVTSTLSTTKKDSRYLFFFLLSFILYFPSVLFRQPFYPDEVRDLYIARHISGLKEFLLPHYLGKIYYGKPPLYFWILHLFSKLPLNEFLLFSVLLNTLIAFILLSLNYVFFKKEGIPQTGFLSSLLLATTGVFYAMSVIVRMDVLFLLFIFTSLYFMWFAVKEDRGSYSSPSVFFIFLAVFTKGALGFVFPLFLGAGLAVMFRTKEAKRRILYIIVGAAAAIGLWLLFFSLIDHSYFKHMLFEQTFARALNVFNHKEPVYYYIPFLFPVFLPWTFMGLAYFFSKREKSLWERWFILWFIGGFIILSLIGSKMPMYLLLLAVPFAGLTADLLRRADEATKTRLLFFTLFILVLLTVSAVIYFYLKQSVMPFGAAWTPLLFMGALILMHSRPFTVQLRIFISAWIVFLILTGLFFMPAASRYSRCNRLAEFLKTNAHRFTTVYVQDKKLLLLTIYPLPQRVVYIKDIRDLPSERRFVLISKEPRRGLHTIRKTGRFYVMSR